MALGRKLSCCLLSENEAVSASWRRHSAGSIVHTLPLLLPPLLSQVVLDIRDVTKGHYYPNHCFVHPLTPFSNGGSANKSLELRRKTKMRILSCKQSSKHAVDQRICPVWIKNDVHVHVALCMLSADIGPSILHQPVWILPRWLFSRLLDPCSAESPFLNLCLSCCGLFPHSLPPFGNKSVFP